MKSESTAGTSRTDARWPGGLRRFFACFAVSLAASTTGCGERGAAMGIVTPPDSITTRVDATDLRFKGVGAPSGGRLSVFSAFGGGSSTVIRNSIGTPLEMTPCGPFTDGPNCSWPYAIFSPRSSPAGMNSVYFSDVLANFTTDLTKMQTGGLATAGAENLGGVITGLMIDESSNVFAVSALQPSDMDDYVEVQGAVAPTELQAAATRRGLRSQVVTAIAFRDGAVVYVAYGRNSASPTTYDVAIVPARFDDIPVQATALGNAGYFITAVGGNQTRGYVLVGTRQSGQTAPHPVLVATDSGQMALDPSFVDPRATIANDGFAIVGGMFDAHAGSTKGFNLYIGQK
jgi:hypothetical protein